MVDLSKVSQAVQKFVAGVAKEEGNKKKIDTKNEYDKLANYLAGNQDDMNTHEKEFIQGYMIEFTNSQEVKYECTIDDSKSNTIKTGINDSWVTIIKNYYPALIEACNGKLYGKDGAIEYLKRALCTDENGKVDKDKLKNLELSATMPEKINLPSQINGVNVK